MRGKLIYLVIVLSCLRFTAKAQNGFDVIYDFCTDTGIVASKIGSCFPENDRYFVAGLTMTPGVSSLHAFLAAFNYNGQPIWNKKLLFDTFNIFGYTDQLIKLSEDRFLLTGCIDDIHINPQIAIYQPYQYIFNKAGDSIRFTSYKDSFRIRFYVSALLDGNNIVTLGMKTSKGFHKVGQFYDADSSYVWLCKYDTLGNLLWERSLYGISGVPTYQHPYKIVQSADKQYYLIYGEIRDPAANKYSSTFIKTDTAGNPIWIKTLYKQYLSFNEGSVVTNPSGGYYFITSNSYLPDNGNPGDPRVYFGKLDDDGNVLWTKDYKDSLYYAQGYKIMFDKDGSHLMMLATGSSDTHTGLIKADTNGNIIWCRIPQRIYHSYFIQKMNSLAVTPDGRYLMGGFISSYIIPGVFDTAGDLSWMVLTDTNGCRFPNDPSCWPVSVKQMQSGPNTVDIYPNPITDELIIENALHAALQVTDLTGRQIYHSICDSNKMILDTRTWPPGSYILYIADKQGNRQAKKLLKE